MKSTNNSNLENMIMKMKFNPNSPWLDKIPFFVGFAVVLCDARFLGIVPDLGMTMGAIALCAVMVFILPAEIFCNNDKGKLFIITYFLAAVFGTLVASAAVLAVVALNQMQLIQPVKWLVELIIGWLQLQKVTDPKAIISPVSLSLFFNIFVVWIKFNAYRNARAMSDAERWNDLSVNVPIPHELKTALVALRMAGHKDVANFVLVYIVQGLKELVLRETDDELIEWEWHRCVQTLRSIEVNGVKANFGDEFFDTCRDQIEAYPEWEGDGAVKKLKTATGGITRRH